MHRVLTLSAAACLTLGAAKAPTVDYRVAIGSAGISVEMRLPGEADGETRLILPANLASDPVVTGAAVQAVSPTERLLRHKPGANLRVRYAVAHGGSEVSALGEAVFARPDGWDTAPATVRWSERPRGWRIVSDLDRSPETSPLTVGDVGRSVVFAGPSLQTADRPIVGGLVRAVTQSDDELGASRLADIAAPAVVAQRAYWGDETGPFLVARSAASDRWQDRGHSFVGAKVDTSDASLPHVLVETHMVGRIERLGRAPGRSADWLAGGMGKFLTERALVRAGMITPEAAAAGLAQDAGSVDIRSRGALLALKWDEDIRRKTGGKADLDDVVLRMRDHARQFPAGQGPDLVTGVVSAAWVVAQLDLRTDIAKYADGSADVDLPEQMFDGCLDARVTVAPGFDSGFDPAASAAAKVAKGVRRRGPAWNSGLRDGMRIESMDLKPGDMTREIVLTVRPSKGGKSRTIRYWPYGDNDVETRKVQLAVGLSETARTTCARKLGGL